MSVRRRQIFVLLLAFAVSCRLSSNLCLGQQSPASGGCGCSHGHANHEHHDHGHSHSHDESTVSEPKRKLLPEELAEEEDLKLYGFGSTHDHHLHHHSHGHNHDHSSSGSHLSGLGLWIYAMGCSLLVSLASLICLILLPLMFVQGKPSKLLVDSLALFGAGAMLGDAFLHQMPHAYGGEHSHSHDHDGHDHAHSEGKHAHSLKDLSVGLSVLAGIVLFLIVEKLVRYIEEVSGDSNLWGHTHHHHHKKSKKKSKGKDVAQAQSSEDEILETTSKLDDKKQSQSESGLKKRKKKDAQGDEKPIADSVSSSLGKQEPSKSSSNLVFGYLNLFSDGVHNFTDGMALGSAFLLYGSVGGWSRTLFLLAHEIPQEIRGVFDANATLDTIGDFGILVRSGFSVSKALFFNFLSALVALAGTALALLLGQDPGHSSLIEGFTAGGFIYIAVAGVLAEMNNSGSSAWKSTMVQLVALTSGMAVALGISLVE